MEMLLVTVLACGCSTAVALNDPHSPPAVDRSKQTPAAGRCGYDYERGRERFDPVTGCPPLQQVPEGKEGGPIASVQVAVSPQNGTRPLCM